MGRKSDVNGSYGSTNSNALSLANLKVNDNSISDNQMLSATPSNLLDQDNLLSQWPTLATAAATTSRHLNHLTNTDAYVCL